MLEYKNTLILKSKLKKILENFFLQSQIIAELNRKLSNKVMINVGLCISLFDILEIAESFLFPGDGAAHTRYRKYVIEKKKYYHFFSLFIWWSNSNFLMSG